MEALYQLSYSPEGASSYHRAVAVQLRFGPLRNLLGWPS